MITFSRFAVPFLSLALATFAGPPLLNNSVDFSADFVSAENTYFTPDRVVSFDPQTGRGALQWKRKRAYPTMLFNHHDWSLAPVGPREFPADTYPADPELPFSIEFVSASTVRLRLHTSKVLPPPRTSLMLLREPQDDGSWRREKVDGGYRYTSAAGSVVLREKPWRIELRDAGGRLLTETVINSDPVPFSFIRRASDFSRSVAANFALSPGEKVFGGGESFTGFDKRGQKLLLRTTDALSAERPAMYKPVPFVLSSRGYGIFVHTSSPVAMDIGATHTARNSIMVAEDNLDLFLFLGTPKEIIGAYTGLTGRAAMPPLWSFGLWMSRITYKSEAETREVAAKIRSHRIPCDVIHLDTGWFETDWQCDYTFSRTRFSDPRRMIEDLRRDGFRISLWQLPYFIPKNRLFPEIIDQGLAVKDAAGGMPTDDAVLDFSNPRTVAWYQDKLAGLLRLGVAAIKTDFGEAAPDHGLYASGRTGLFEHNLYPLRYQQAAADITREITGDSIIWARAGWAGAQRNPVHWGGDAGKTFGAMAATLRAGLSIGLSGFSFWSHDIGGFAGRNNLDVYRAWVPFGMLSSHSRVHGEPPKEPWEFGEAFVNEFRLSAELRYRLMPYIYAQARECTETGLPMMRALFVEFPRDRGAWHVDDAYILGSSLLVAPLFEPGATRRDVYLPSVAEPGAARTRWIDYQTGRVYEPGWQTIEAGPIPCVLLVRDGTLLPRIALAPSTQQLNWGDLELAVYASGEMRSASGLICLPSDGRLHTVAARRAGNSFSLVSDPLAGSVRWNILPAPPERP